MLADYILQPEAKTQIASIAVKRDDPNFFGKIWNFILFAVVTCKNT